jgi:hypothetical protein
VEITSKPYLSLSLIGESGYLFTDNGYKVKSFNTIDFTKSQHYNPLAYVKTDADILSFVNCFIMNTTDPKKSGGDAFWENSERLLYTALIALLRDWFPKKDYSIDGLLTLLSLAEASENDEKFESPLDMLFKEIETGKAYRKNPAYYAKKRQKQQQAARNAVLQRDVIGLQNEADVDEPEYTYQSSMMKRVDGVRPSERGGLSANEDFALANYKKFKTAAGKTLKSILISCNVRLESCEISEVRELLRYDEMELDKLGDEGSKMVIFAILSDTDKTFSFLHAIMMWQAIDILCRRANIKYKEETEDMLDHLQNKNQRMYIFTGLFYTYASTKEELDNQALKIISTARQHSMEVDLLDFRQPEGLNSILPLGHNHVDQSRRFTTAQTAILMPFATQELNDEGGTYYGQNQQSSNLVLCDRKKLTSPVAFVCGKTGSGKGMFVKQEMTGTILKNPTDEIFVIDRAGEYTEIVRRYGGNVFDFAVNSGTYLNPLDTTTNDHMSKIEQVAFKVDAVLAQAGASAAEAGNNLSEAEQSIIQRCVEEAFRQAELHGDGQPPLLQDFYDILKKQPEPDAQIIALRYERFVKGSMSFFNHHSNVDFDNRIIDFNLKELPDNMLVFALINVCEAVRNRMYQNADRNVRTWLYVEEMQSMFAYPTVLRYFSRFANEGRKFGMLLTGITQNASAMLANEAARNIVTNADFLMLLKQSALDRKEWIRLLNLSEQEEEFIDESCEPGNGLLIAGPARVPIRGKFPKGNKLYDLFSTNPNDIAERKAREKMFGE